VKLEFGPASDEDVPAIEKMLAENDWGVQRYEWGRWLVARDGSEIVGAIHVADVDGALYLDDVLVTEERRGAGIGSRFMRILLDDRDVYLACHDIRIAFYERLGFTEIAESALPKPIIAHANRTEDLPTAPDHVHHMMRWTG
jgi:predicted N-acetyltransferase YhbS